MTVNDTSQITTRGKFTTVNTKKGMEVIFKLTETDTEEKEGKKNKSGVSATDTCDSAPASPMSLSVLCALTVWLGLVSCLSACV